jgi:SAM-dependent MidA family methyltransferase
MSFRRFMELALYHPEHGYYEQPLLPQTGRAGDFYTSVSVGPVFGELLGYFIQANAKDWAGKFELIEAGAHAGQLAADILTALKLHAPEVFERAHYQILDPSPTRRTAQAATLAEYAGKVTWANDVAELPDRSVQGIVISNELLDAFPVHRIGWSVADKAWFEWLVEVKNERLCWQRTEPSSLPTDLRAQLPPVSAELAALLPDGFTTEVCPAATQWWQTAADKLKSGWLLTFDYGLEALDFLSPERAKGTLRAYTNHRLTDDLLINIGEQDLTAHINFTAIREAGERAGLQTVHDEAQARFLSRVLAQAAGPNFQWPPAKIRQFQTLTHPDHLGRSFRVLGQRR